MTERKTTKMKYSINPDQNLHSTPNAIGRIRLTGILLLLFTTNLALLHANTYVNLSKSFLEKLRKKESADDIVEQYAQLDLDRLAKGLNDRAAQFAFWTNTYNAFVIHLLSADPSRFDNRGNFFGSKQIRIAGRDFSLDNIEHDIIRGSRIKWSLGYLKKWWVSEAIQKLRIDKRDGRIHFALNCGAKSCPPVAIYDEATVFEQFDRGSKQYLEQVSEVDGNVVRTTPLFSWFRADFGGKSGAKDMLRAYGIIGSNAKDVSLRFKSYDWTLSIGNFTDL